MSSVKLVNVSDRVPNIYVVRVVSGLEFSHPVMIGN